MLLDNPNFCLVWDERLKVWRQTAADRILSGLMGNFKAQKHESKKNCPDNQRPEKICGMCRYFNPEFPVNGKPAPVCLAIKTMRGGTEYTNPRGTQSHYRCSNGRYKNGIGQ